MFGRPRLGLALGGGAARGLAHIGVLRALARHQIPVNLIVGTSIGALVGGLYALTLDIEETERRLREFLGSPVFRANRFQFFHELRSERKGLIQGMTRLVRRGILVGYGFSRSSFISARTFEQNFNHLLDDVRIEQTQVPFAVVTCDLRRGEEVVLTEGPMRRAVSASSAIPGILPPVEWNGRLLVDGGWTSRVPVLPAFKLGADAVIAVDISAELRDTERLKRGYDIFIRASAIADSVLKRMQCRMADVLIRPEVGSIHWADFSRAHECIERGEAAAEAKIGEIEALLRQRRWTRGVIPGHGRRIARYYLGTRLQKAPKE